LLDRFVEFLFVALLFTVFLPLLAWYSILAGLDSLGANFKPRKVTLVDFFKLQSAGEFNFNGAIEAYEGLIDSTFAKGRR
jgi:hypothetical protein